MTLQAAPLAMILLLDNYDSFTYNLFHLLQTTETQIVIQRNDERSHTEIEALNLAAIVISPGPGRPENAGICVDVVRTLGCATPILGVCLGHQVIGMAFGATVSNAPSIMHGKLSPVYHDGRTLFEGIENPFLATRYHSLVISPQTLPPCLMVSARTDDGVIMGVRHTQFPIEGIQFHPESFMTEGGKRLIRNWFREVLKRKTG